ncbi:MAG: HAMP domain-containing sensor histidine kinase, partial [Myxococcota bacterium]
MRRIRVVLALLLIALALPLGFLVKRALDGLAFESRLRHDSIAERAFDEMERELSLFLRTEEERPFSHYGFYDGETPEGFEPPRTPLGELPRWPFVVGYYQIEPDGSVRSPLEPRDRAQARAQGRLPPPPEVSRAIERTRALVLEHWGSSDPFVEAPGDAPSPSPGSSLRLGRATEPGLGSRAPAREGRELDAYDALQSFNRALTDRVERKQKVEEAPYQSLPSALAPLGSPAAKKTRAAEAAVRFESSLTFDEKEAEPGAGKGDPLRVVIDPLVGRPAGSGHLLLYRSVSIAGATYRQGLVIDLVAMGRWIEDRVIGSSGLGGVASTRFFRSRTRAPGPATEAPHAYLHRFAEPFDALAVELQLEPLSGVGSPGPIYALAGLGLLLGALGLLSIHRMVSVVVDFADRRSNFVAAVSHELKTPLTAIRMYAEMLRDDLVPVESKRREYYQTISDESERLSRLIHNVLEFSSLEGGRRELSLVVGPIEPVLREAAERLAPHASRQGFALRVEAQPDLPAVRFDRDAVLQMIFNLLDNAFKYA